jgi:hypothetical protein
MVHFLSIKAKVEFVTAELLRRTLQYIVRARVRVPAEASR